MANHVNPKGHWHHDRGWEKAGKTCLTHRPGNITVRSGKEVTFSSHSYYTKHMIASICALNFTRWNEEYFMQQYEHIAGTKHMPF